MASFRAIALLALTTGFASISNAQASGSGSTTRYWDCCKGSCSWSGKADVSNPVTTCDIKDTPLTDSNAASGCESGGTAFMCSDQSPWAANDTLAFGFAAVNIAGGSESSWCCACYKLTFTSTSLATSGKTMIVQATNTGGDLGSNQFDLAMPGGGVGIYNGCTDEWGAPSSGWGAQYGGISTDTCSTFPTALQSGCGFRFDWFEGADNPTVDFEQVTCPSELTAKTNCVRDGETPFAYASGSTSSASANVAAVVASSSSSSAEASVAPTSSSASVESSSAAPTSAASSAAASVEVSSSAATPAASSAASSAVEYSAASSVASSAAASSPASSSVVSYSTGGYIPGASSAAPASSTAAAAQASAPAAADDDASCNVQYVYEYDL